MNSINRVNPVKEQRRIPFFVGCVFFFLCCFVFAKAVGGDVGRKTKFPEPLQRRRSGGAWAGGSGVKWP